jgi:hypothetical protein
MKAMTTVSLAGITASLLACSSTGQAPLPAAPAAAPVQAVAAPALTGLEMACLNDPLDAAAWRRLAAALALDGQPARAAQALRQAGMLEQHDLRADVQLMEGEFVATRLITRADGLLELRREPAATVRLEVRNGNGVRGMARLVARSLDAPGLRVVRLSNERGFAVGATQVEYHGDHLAAARQLAQRVGAGRIVEVEGSLAPAEVRVLLGHDQKKKKPPRRAAMEERTA